MNQNGSDQEVDKDMLLPKGKAVHENLNTSYTNLNVLLHEFSGSGFTGYVSIHFWQYEAVLFLERGSIINAVSEGNAKKTGQDAVNAAMNKAKEKDGTISVYQLSEETITMLSSAVEGDAVHRNLTTDFSSLDKLIVKLKSESHTGHIEVAIKDNSGNGIVFLHSGEPVEAILSDENGAVQSGSDTLNSIIAKAAKEGAVFNVFKANLSKIKSGGHIKIDGADVKDLLLLIQEIFSGAERVVDSMFKKGDFVFALKKASTDIADRYPFMDPFAGEFDYKDGKLVYAGGAEAKKLLEGSTEALKVMLNEFSARASENGILPKIKAELQPVREKYREQIEAFNIASAMPQLFGSSGDIKVDRQLTLERDNSLSARKGQITISEDIISEWEKNGIINISQVKIIFPDGKAERFKVSKEKSAGNKLKMAPIDIESLKLQIGHLVKIMPA
ncbi:MAG: hypothetical protein HZC10_05535 [Nitrospirae bacterium]|nr:hypothetical protein [Nitrospirota bacterium]